MAGTITLPAVGPVKKEFVAIAGVVTAGAVAWSYMKRRAPLDEGPLEPVGEAIGLIENTPGFMSTGPPGLYGDDDDDPKPGTFITNGQWHQWVVDYLVQNGTDRAAADTAVGKFLSREKLTSVEANYIRVAQGAGGMPPQGTYTILLETTGGVTQPGTRTKPGAVTGLQAHTSERRATYLTFRWGPPATGTAPSGYRVYVVQGENDVIQTTTLGPGTLKFTTKTNLRPDRPYRFRIFPYVQGIGNGPVSSVVARTTKK